MKKSVVLQALQTQLEKVKRDAIKHEKRVFEPAMAALKKSVVEFFSEITPGVDNIDVSSDCITIYPNPNRTWNNQIDLKYRGTWDKKNEYVELSANRPDMQSNQNIAEPVHYYNTLNAVVNCFSLIANTYINEWIPAMQQLADGKNAFYSPIWELEREIGKIEKEIAEEEKQKYFQTGAADTLKSYKHFDWKWQDVGGHKYIIEEKEKSIRMEIGRAKWDYVYVHEFKVDSYPKAKHAKVVLKYKSESTDTAWRTIEINKTRFADFISNVYNWQTRSAAEKTAAAEERYAEKQKQEQTA